MLLAPVAGLFMAGQAGAGNLDAPAAPASSNSAMWTLEDIYNKLNTRTNVSRRTEGFTEPMGKPTVGTMHTLNDIMTLATNRAPVAKTGQTQTVHPYEPPNYSVPAWADGGLQKGVAWPNPRFTVLGDTNAPVDVLTNCVRDNLTGLIWARKANLGGANTWTATYNVITNSAGPVNGANYGGYSDWRWPNAMEMLSLLAWQFPNTNRVALSDGTGTNAWTEADGPFTSVQANYWTSTASANSPGAIAFFLNMYGVLNAYTKDNNAYVWPVRGGD